MNFTRIDLSAQIKSALTIQEVAEGYGLHFERNKALCPFHNDSHPSASIKNNRFHCYVCGLHLGVIDFVMKLFCLDCKAAMNKLNADFRLNLSCAPLSRAEREKRNIARAERLRQREAAEAEYEAFRDEYIDIEYEASLIKEYLKKKTGEVWLRAWAQSRYVELDYWLLSNMDKYFKR